MAPKKGDKSEAKILLGRPKGTLKMGLVGLPNVGKSMTFNMLAKQQVPSENYPFCTIDPHEARMSVPDDRFRWLCQHFKPKSSVPATLSIFDIAGLVPGAHKGEGLGNAFLSNIQAVDGIFHVVRGFEDADVIHTDGDVNPVRDMQTIDDELRMKDVERLTKIVDELQRVTARGQDKSKKAELEILEKVLTHVRDDKQWISMSNAWTLKEVDLLNEHQFLTAKPVIYLLNLSIKDYKNKKNKFGPKIVEWVNSTHPGKIIPYSALFESELFDREAGAAGDNASANASTAGTVTASADSQIPKIINTGYSTLNLIHFFTCGADEVKCWTIRAGTKAPQAAGTIHTDMEKGFICADIYKYTDLTDYGSEQEVKAHGKLMIKGKDYVMEDGDIAFFKFNPAGSKK